MQTKAAVRRFLLNRHELIDRQPLLYGLSNDLHPLFIFSTVAKRDGVGFIADGTTEERMHLTKIWLLFVDLNSFSNDNTAKKKKLNVFLSIMHKLITNSARQNAKEAYDHLHSNYDFLNHPGVDKISRKTTKAQMTVYAGIYNRDYALCKNGIDAFEKNIASTPWP